MQVEEMVCVSHNELEQGRDGTGRDGTGRDGTGRDGTGRSANRNPVPSEGTDFLVTSRPTVIPTYGYWQPLLGK